MCVLCGDPGRPDLGPLLSSLQVHLICLKFSRVSLNTSGQPPTEPEVIREVRRIKGKSCVYCKKKGAFVNCGIQVCIVLLSVSCVNENHFSNASGLTIITVVSPTGP